ncbi:hypothetical protein KKH27_07230 [bacterium]|nr:hypothetical protein [bacterium]MBU1985125.1 hypothetical protein [bacterium]
MRTFGPRSDRLLIPNLREDLPMEDFRESETGLEEVRQDEAVEHPAETAAETWRYGEGEPSLLDAGFTIELRNVKTAMVIAPNHPIPVTVEGLLLEHHEMPLAADMEVILTADDREIVRERFFLPTPRRAEVMEAHRELTKMSPDFLTDSRLRDTAMRVYFPELCEEFDLWYRVAIDEEGVLYYAVHIGPAGNQDMKKKIEGRLEL